MRRTALTAAAFVALMGIGQAMDHEQILPKWNLKQGKRYVYAYQVNGRVEGSVAGKTLDTKMKMGGQITIVAQGDKAKLHYTTKLLRSRTGDVEAPQDMLKAMPTSEKEFTMRADGTLDPLTSPAGNIQVELDLRLVFPLPPEPLVPGKTVSESITLMGQPGTAEYQYLSLVQARGGKHLSYRVLWKLEPSGKSPAEVDLLAETTVLFDVDGGYFLSSVTWMELSPDDEDFDMEMECFGHVILTSVADVPPESAE